MGKRKPRPKIKDYQNAIKGSFGIMAQIARKVGVDWHTANKKIKNNEKLYNQYIEELEKSKDFTESSLIKNIKDGDQRAIEYYLDHKAKDRGYGRQQTIKHEGEVGRKIEVNIDDLSEEELKAIAKLNIINDENLNKTKEVGYTENNS